MATPAQERGLSSTVLSSSEIAKAANATGAAVLDGIKLAADIAAKNPEQSVQDGVALAEDSGIVVTWCCALWRRCRRSARASPTTTDLSAQTAAVAGTGLAAPACPACGASAASPSPSLPPLQPQPQHPLQPPPQ